ncbi:MAG TPA: TOBE domain-containing protein, partial [Bosea sp. (in: a-proteobacteria)]|nr:TOBE domain-containing protein [Bosea sp. (in: a-proteobacteria)]
HRAGSMDGALALSCVIANREFLGASVRYGARIGSAEVAVDMPFQSGRELFEVGSEASLKLAPGSLHWLSA